MMPSPRFRHAIGLILAWMLGTGAAVADNASYSFSVLNQRSATLTAEYWNPIFAYVAQKTGIQLKLKMGLTAPETTALTLRGEAQFAYTNHLFTPERIKLGWRVIARPDTDGVRGQIVVAADSPVKRLEDLEGQVVVFPSLEAFVGYKVPMDALLRKGIKVTANFAGNQEGAMAQLKFGKAVAAGVNEDVMRAFALREQFAYRVIWASDNFNDLAVMVNPATVPGADVKTVQQALLGMSSDPVGKKILEQGAQLLKFPRPIGFVMAADKDYENYRNFFRNTLLKD